MHEIQSLFHAPKRSYLIIIVALLALVLVEALSAPVWVELLAVLLGGLPVFVASVRSAIRRRISIETFNLFAICAALLMSEYTSALFIVMMLACADILEAYTEARAHRAIEELIKLKPQKATVDTGGGMLRECVVGEVLLDDIVLIRQGEQVPVDGIVISGEASCNESSVTGESVPVEKREGDKVMSGTLNENGMMRVRATAVGKDSTIERMASLIEEAAKNKSQVERVADKFAGIFLPVVALLGIGTYLVTKNVSMVTALFLVACADDMAVAIPLAMTAALGQAAKRGVIVKGGSRLYSAADITTVLLDKTGTLTYGKLDVEKIEVLDGFNEQTLLQLAGSAEKFSAQPMGRAIFARALQDFTIIADPVDFKEIKGGGVSALCDGRKVLLGTKVFLEENGVELLLPNPRLGQGRWQEATLVHIAIDGAQAGSFRMADSARPEAAESIGAMLRVGVRRIVMLTGDTEAVAGKIASQLGIEEYRAHVKPEEKLREVERLMLSGKKEKLAVVGDGINDAPALARADVGVAMGGGMAVSLEAADIIILTDNLMRLPEIILLGRRTKSVIRGDVVIWVVSNLLGFALVFAGVMGPAAAAFYNFATDFFPLFNSARLFRRN